ncbi:MAG: GTP-binding protein, partial [Stackebrandtia sp.]
GVEALAAGVREHLPVASGAAGGEPRGSVFKVERGPAGEKIAYVRMRAGTLRPRTRPRLHRAGGDSFEGKVTAVRVFDRGAATRIAEAGAGAIAKVWGLTDVRIGDAVGSPDELHAGGLFAQPTLDTIIRPRNPRERPALHDALRVLSERDPLVDPRFDESGQDITVNLYGEVQKEVIAATLAEQFGVEVDFDETRTIYVERPVGVGEAVEAMGEEPSTHFYATIGLRVQPGPVGSGVAYGIEVERGSIPARFHKAIEETVRETLKQGLHGWGVIDCVITLIRSGSAAAVSAGKPPLSTTKEFRLLTPLVLMRALRQAGTQVLEPINRFELETPNAVSAEVLQELAKAGATVTGHAVHGATCRLTGTMRAQDVHGFERLLPALTQGESMFVSHLDGHRPISGDPPTRKRTDGDPLHLDSYLTHLHNQQ